MIGFSAEKRTALTQLQPFLSSLVHAREVISLGPGRYPNTGDPISFWLQLESDIGGVEGKLHLPARETDKIVIFEPGFPGDGSTRLENLHLKMILQQGYALFAVRHNGTIINGQYSNNYLNCPEKQEKAKLTGQHVTGIAENVTLVDWLKEPQVSLRAFYSVFSEVYLMSHSFGTLATLISLKQETDSTREDLRKVKRLVSLSGATGRVREINDPILRQWRRNLDSDMARERVSIGAPEENIEILRDAYITIHKSEMKIPELMDMVYINPWGDNKENLDEFVSPLEAVDIIASLGRGSLVIDKTQSADESAGRIVHDMDNLQTLTLLNFLSGDLPGTNKIIVIK